MAAASRSDRSLIEWSDPRDTNEKAAPDTGVFSMTDQTMRNNNNNNNKTTAAVSLVSSSSSSSSPSILDRIVMETSKSAMLSKEHVAAAATNAPAETTVTPKRRTSAAAATVTVTPSPDDDATRQRRQPFILASDPTTAAVASARASHPTTTTSRTRTIATGPHNFHSDDDDDDDDHNVDCPTTTTTTAGDGRYDCRKIPCFSLPLLPFLIRRPLDFIPFLTNDRRHDDDHVEAHASTSPSPPLSRPSNQTSKDINNAAVGSEEQGSPVIMMMLPSTSNSASILNFNKEKVHKNSEEVASNDTFLGSPSSLCQSEGTTTTTTAAGTAATMPILRTVGGQEQQQAVRPSHRVTAAITGDTDDHGDNSHSTMQEQPPTSHDKNDAGSKNGRTRGLHHYNEQQQPPASTATTTATTAPSTNTNTTTSPTWDDSSVTITDTKSSCHKQRRLFPFAKKNKKSDSPSVISSSSSNRSLMSSSHLGSSSLQQKKKKNRLKTFFSGGGSSKSNSTNRKPPLQPPLVVTLVSPSPCNKGLMNASSNSNSNNNSDPCSNQDDDNDDDDAHDCLDLSNSFSPLLDDDTHPNATVSSTHCQTEQDKQHARHRKKQGRLSSSFFRSASSKNKSSSSVASLPQPDEEQNPRSCQKEQGPHLLQRHGSSSVAAANTRMTLATSMTSSPLSLEPLFMAASTFDASTTTTTMDTAVNTDSSSTIIMNPDRSSNSCSISSMDWLISRQARLEQEISNLLELEKASQRVQQCAMATTSRISQLTQTMMGLQEALRQSSAILQQETFNLQQVEAEQARIEEATLQATQQVQELITVGQRPRMTCTSTTPVTTSKAELNSQGHCPSPRTAVKKSTGTSSPMIQQQQQQPEFPRRRAATEDASTSAQHRCEAFQTQKQHDLMRMTLPEESTSPRLSPPRRRANTEPIRPFSSSSVASFMRVSDLEIDMSSSSLSLSFHDVAERGDMNDIAAQVLAPEAATVTAGKHLQRLSNPDFFLLDENIALVLDKLTKLGLEVSTDESERFAPTRETQWLLQTKKYSDDTSSEWPFSPWHAARDKDVLVWTGGVPHKGFGHDWPVVKARGIVRATPRQLLDFLLDSKEIKRYNKMSQGRDDVYILQAGVDTKADDSLYGFAGDARILRALNKPKLLPKTMEMLSLWYSQPLEQHPGSYMIVSRSVWENELGTITHDSSCPSSISSSDESNNRSNSMLRCEMLLGVQLLRPVTVPSNAPSSIANACELTTITHVFSTGVPELLAKRAAPSSAANLIREIQAIFL